MRGMMERHDHFREDVFGMDAFAETPEQFVESWPEIKKKSGGKELHNQKKALDRLEVDLSKLLGAHKRVRFKFLLFLILNLSFITLSILGLLYPQSLTTWGKWIAVGTGMAMGFTLGSTISLCSSLVRS